jgi:hypothetical protein
MRRTIFYCECGCGKVVKLGNRFLKGHARKGKKMSEGHKKKIALGNSGKKRTAEMNFRNSETHLGKKASEETKAKMSKAHMGHVVSKETREKFSKIHKDKIVTQETRKRMSDSQTPEAEVKRKKTKLERYGDSNFNNREKAKKTKLKKYGDSGYTNKEQALDTMLNKYGRGNCTNSRKAEKTKLAKYGRTGLVNRDRSEATWNKKYGVTNPSQAAVVFKKIVESKGKPYKMPSGKIVKVLGYENFALNYLFTNIYIEDDIELDPVKFPEFWYSYENKQHRYFPDFYVEKDDLIIEVKSHIHWYEDSAKIELKKQACIDAGYDYWFMIFDEQNLIELQEYKGA